MGKWIGRMQSQIAPFTMAISVETSLCYNTLRPCLLLRQLVARQHPLCFDFRMMVVYDV